MCVRESTNDMFENIRYSSANMAFVEGMRILQGPNSFGHNIHKDYFLEEPCLAFKSRVSAARSVIGQEPSRCSESNISATRSDIWQETCREPLHIFVLGPSLFGKRRLIECAAGRNLEIATQKDIYFAYKLSGFLLQGVEVEINLWHVGNIYRSLGNLQDFYQKYKTCFMLVYDVNDSTTFDDVRQWIPSLRCVLDDHVPIVLVGYEDEEETLTSKLTPVSYSDGMKAITDFELKTYYEFSDMTGPAVVELIFDAAHIALESKITTPDSELAESKENSIT
ncbi:hypothetical protein AVEN_122555-1 [Araneus ventricosus]|uniref:Uncharacterized protein n=1 Tax=Araneus ventricosus TaxID=182803 RepID=A0A4Y2IQL3_ARAVE|nr:hypothetical protein AVEN_122555-1 [Araneus ventricosus]